MYVLLYWIVIIVIVFYFKLIALSFAANLEILCLFPESRCGTKIRRFGERKMYPLLSCVRADDYSKKLHTRLNFAKVFFSQAARMQ